MDIRSHNREAWDHYVDIGVEWTKPVSPEIIANARRGEWSVLLTEQKSVPREWFPEMNSLDVLCLACGGGQQGPVFTSAGAHVTVFDNSPKQLARDREVAEREGLDIHTVEGDMRNLSVFADESFDFVFNPVSTLFVPEVRPVLKEAYRVLRPGGTFLLGAMNPFYYIFDLAKMEKGELEVKFSVPYSDTQSMTETDLQEYLRTGNALEFSHTLTDLIAGQTDVGFHIIGFYEDRHSDSPLSKYHPTYIATRALKP